MPKVHWNLSYSVVKPKEDQIVCIWTSLVKK